MQGAGCVLIPDRVLSIWCLPVSISWERRGGGGSGRGERVRGGGGGGVFACLYKLREGEGGRGCLPVSISWERRVGERGRDGGGVCLSL